MMSAAFRFGVNDSHEFRAECDMFGGERYFVDGALIEKRWSLGAGGSREFEVDGHRIRISLRATSKEIRSEAYVDGQLRVKELFPQLAQMRRGPWPLVVRVIMWIVIASVSFLAARALLN
jgi:hypothetical protein